MEIIIYTMLIVIIRTISMIKTAVMSTRLLTLKVQRILYRLDLKINSDAHTDLLWKI